MPLIATRYRSRVILGQHQYISPLELEWRKRDAAGGTKHFYSTIQSADNRGCNITGVLEARIEQSNGVWAKSTPTLRVKVYKSQNLTDMGLIRSNGIAREKSTISLPVRKI